MTKEVKEFIEHQVNDEEVSDEEIVTEESVKTFTEDEVTEIVQKRLKRELNKLEREKQKEKEQKAVEENNFKELYETQKLELEQLRQDKLEHERQLLINDKFKEAGFSLEQANDLKILVTANEEHDIQAQIEALTKFKTSYVEPSVVSRESDKRPPVKDGYTLAQEINNRIKGR